MKAYLRFDLNDSYDREQHEQALQASDMAAALHEIRQRIFRPARKHGYNDEMLDSIPGEAVAKMEALFNEICDDYDVMKYT